MALLKDVNGQGYITGQLLAVDGGEWFGKKAMMPRELVLGISGFDIRSW